MKKIKYNDQISKDYRDAMNEDSSVTGFIHFGRLVFGKKLKPNVLKKKLFKLIDLDDYPEFTLQEMLDHFQKLTNMEKR